MQSDDFKRENAGSIAFPEKQLVRPLARPPRCKIRVPGSKSITNRALVLAALADRSTDTGDESRGWSHLSDALRSEDTEVMVRCLQRLGVALACDWFGSCILLDRDKDGNFPDSREQIWVEGCGGNFPATQAELFVSNSGTTMRFLTALVCLGRGRYRLDGVQRMRERPIEDLLAAVRQLGVAAMSEAGNGCPPVVVEASGLPGGLVSIKGDVSSQFLSGLLMVAPLARDTVTIEVDGPLVSWPYVTMTLELMRHFGAAVEVCGRHRFSIPGRQRYRARALAIEPDASAASYFAGAAALTGGEIELTGLTASSLQGDVRFLDVLEEMGCQVTHGPSAISVRGGELHGIDVDMNDISDTVMTLAAVACFAAGPTTVRNVAHIRHKETDRLAALATELRRLGAGVEEFSDGLTVIPQTLHGAEVETYNDHRMAMSLALIGLKVPGVVIKNPACVGKTYPEFFADLEKLRCPIEAMR